MKYFDISEIDQYMTVMEVNTREYGRQTVVAIDDLEYLPNVDIVHCKDCGRRNKSADLTDTVLCSWLHNLQMPKDAYCSYGINIDKKDDKNAVDGMKEIQKHGKWIKTDSGHKCSVCNYEIVCSNWNNVIAYPTCPQCDTIMDGRINNNK